MGTYELETRIKRLESKWNRICCFLRSCLGISSTGNPSLVLNQQGDWVNNGGGGSYYLYSENYDAGSFVPSTVTGLNAVSIGGSNDASGYASTTMGSLTIASGDNSTALGIATTASGQFSTAIGSGTTASGRISTAIGNNTTASGRISTAMGIGTTASGDYSTAIGNTSTALSFVETSLGTYNTNYTPNSTTTFDSTDRLLVVGNGDGTQSDAFTILKNAKTGIGYDNFETTTSEAKLQVNGNIKAVTPAYDNDAAAGVGGLATGEQWQTSATNTLSLPTGVLMVKQ